MTTLEIKEAVRQRDGYCCSKCGITQNAYKAETGRSLDVHRVSPGSEYSVDGCISLCQPCHGTEPKSPKWSPNNSAKIEVRAEPEWVAWVHRAAQRKGLSASSWVRMIVTERMQSDNIPEHEPPARKPKP